MHCFPSFRRKSGFTLIELLVVIAIIAILAAILFPVFARARENARRSSCQSNMKQMGIGFAQYLQDYDGQYPYGCDKTVDTSNAGAQDAHSEMDYGAACNQQNTRMHWMDKLQPYIKSAQVFSCPSLKSYRPSFGPTYTPVNMEATATSPNINVQIPYGYNCDYIGGCGWPGNGAPGAYAVKETQLQESARTILVTESTPWNYSGGFPGGAASNFLVINFSSMLDGTRHLEGTNQLFTDGHVKWMKPETVLGNSQDLFKIVKS